MAAHEGLGLEGELLRVRCSVCPWQGAACDFNAHCSIGGAKRGRRSNATCSWVRNPRPIPLSTLDDVDDEEDGHGQEVTHERVSFLARTTLSVARRLALDGVDEEEEDSTRFSQPEFVVAKAAVYLPAAEGDALIRVFHQLTCVT